VIMIFVILRLSFQGRSAELNLVLRVGNNLLERSTFGYYFGDVIRNCTFANVVQFCMNFEERWRAIDLNFNLVI
jgi:hypothetical protein